MRIIKLWQLWTVWYLVSVKSSEEVSVKMIMINWYRDGFATSTADMAKVACRMLREPLFPNLSKLGIGE